MMDIQKLKQSIKIQDKQDMKDVSILYLIERLEKAEAQLAELAQQEPAASIVQDLSRLFVKISYPTTLQPGDELFTRAAPPAPVVSGCTMPRYEFAKMVNELRVVPSVQGKREKIISVLRAFNIKPANGSVADE